MVKYGANEFRDAVNALDATREEWVSWGEVMLQAGVDPLAASAVADGFADQRVDDAMCDYLLDEDGAVDAWRADARVMFWEGLRTGLALVRQSGRLASAEPGATDAT